MTAACLVFPRVDECARLAGLPIDADVGSVLSHARVREHFQQLLDRLLRQGTGSANRVARALVLAEPPSIDKGELTDKGSINQRAVLAVRAALIDAVYRGDAAGLLRPAPAPGR